MKSSSDQLRGRGFIDDLDLSEYQDMSVDQLLELLDSKVPTDRAIATRLLENFKEKRILNIMTDHLTMEKKLYVKIELTEAIASYGKEASQVLINYLGKVGNNQHRTLPDKPFQKKNYPLPRDIIARTICKIGKQALPDLKKCLYEGEYRGKLEAIDAIGFISFYEEDGSMKGDLVNVLEKYKDDELLVWKLLRAFQSFKDEEVKEILRNYLNSTIVQHRWEAERSLRQIER